MDPVDESRYRYRPTISATLFCQSPREPINNCRMPDPRSRPNYSEDNDIITDSITMYDSQWQEGREPTPREPYVQAVKVE